jgi:hypothetical protein
VDTLRAFCQPPPLREEAWRFERDGFDERQAATLVALDHGLRPVQKGWTLAELAHLLFLRATVGRWR